MRNPERHISESDEVHISSVIIQVNPDQLASVKHGVEALPFGEVVADDPRGKLVVVLESGSCAETDHYIQQLQTMHHVHSVTMVYHQAEGTDEIDQMQDRDVLP